MAKIKGWKKTVDVKNTEEWTSDSGKTLTLNPRVDDWNVPFAWTVAVFPPNMWSPGDSLGKAGKRLGDWATKESARKAAVAYMRRNP